MPSRFPQWPAFLAAKAELDPHNVFTNPFWERVSGNISLDQYLTPGCSLRGECYCQSDEHCEADKTCQVGLHFDDAKICR